MDEYINRILAGAAARRECQADDQAAITPPKRAAGGKKGAAAKKPAAAAKKPAGTAKKPARKPVEKYPAAEQPEAEPVSRYIFTGLSLR